MFESDDDHVNFISRELTSRDIHNINPTVVSIGIHDCTSEGWRAIGIALSILPKLHTLTIR